MKLDSCWFKCKYLNVDGEVSYFVVNHLQAISLLYGLEHGEFLELTLTDVGFFTKED